MKFLFLFFISISLCWGIKENVAYFPGRSGDIILSNKEQMQDDSFLFVLNNEEIIGEWNQEKEMKEKDIGELIGHLIGGPVYNAKADRKSFPSGNIFNKATGNLFLVVDGVGENRKNRFPRLFQKSGKEMNLLRTSFPQDSISTLASIAAGEDPSIHGIVGSEWYSSEGPISAYQFNALSKSKSFVDRLSLSSSGNSLTISASSSFQMTSALGVHQNLQSTNPEFNNYAIFFNENSESFENAYGKELKGFPSTSRREIIEDISKQQFGSKSFLDRKSLVLSVQGTSQRTNFDLKIKGNFKFFAEMMLINQIIDFLTENGAANRLTLDNVPDLFSFCISTLKEIEKEYGYQSKQFEIACEIMDNFLISAIDRLNNIYHNKLTVQVLFLSENNPINVIRTDIESKEFTFRILEKNTDKNIFDKYFPHIFLLDKKQLNEELCQKMKDQIKFQVSCSSLSSNYLVSNLAANGTDPTKYDSTDAELFHTLLWFSIVLGITLFFAVYSIFSMDVGSDTLLFRATSSKR